MQARPRLGSLGQACGLRGALDGAVHADKDICMVASREARFSGSLLGLLTTAVTSSNLPSCSAARVSLSPSQVVETAEDALDFAVG